MSKTFLDMAIKQAERAGCKAERRGDRLLVTLGENNFSLFICDETVSTLNLERALKWIKGASC